MGSAAIQGIKGSYSDEAAVEMLGPDVDILECRDFNETFAAVLSKRADFAIVPVRNRIVGDIEPVSALLKSSGVKVADELRLPITHVLTGIAGAETENLRTVRSHIEALKQCRRFLSANPHLTWAVGIDTASSIRQVVDEGDISVAAIGSRRAAEMYGAVVLCEEVADEKDNWTAFYLLGN